MIRLGTMPLGVQRNPRYRTVAEADILDLLLFFGWARECRRGGLFYGAAEAREMLGRLIRDGLSFESSGDGVRLFDPAEVLNFVTYTGLRGESRLWEERFVATGRRVVRDLVQGPVDSCDDPPRLGAVGSRRFSVTLRRDFDLRHARPGARVRLRLPLPLEDEALHDLKVDIAPIAGLDADMTISSGRLDACFPMPHETEVTLAATVSFVAHPILPEPSAASLDSATAELYTRPHEPALVISPRIRALAGELAEGTRNPEVMVWRFWDFMLNRLTFGAVHYDELSPEAPTDWVLETGWYDCQIGSAFFAALCRTRGIPARLLSGYSLYPPTPVYHYWSEVWLDGWGWMPFDLTSWALSAGGRDVPWRNYFGGQLDYRMKTQTMPRFFTGNPTVRFPSAWHALPRLEREGASVGYVAVDSGIPIYRDHVSVLIHEPDAGSTLPA